MADFERELNWDDTIEKESDGFLLLPEGDYDFKVTGFARGRYEGGEKIPACNKAILDIEITAPEGTVVLKHGLLLHTKCEGLLSAFFISVGLKKHDEPLKMNWSAVPGKTGRLKLSIREWVATNGEKRKSNDIKRFYEPPKTTTPSFTPGVF